MSDDQKTALELEREKRQLEADATNKTRTGVGTRVKVGATRGRNVSVINWEAFDDSQPETLPKSIKQFMEVSATADEPTLVGYLIVGYNDAQYSAASDEIGEYLNPMWDKDTVAQFRLVVRNYSKGTGDSIEDAVSLIKPRFEKAFAAKKVA